MIKKISALDGGAKRGRTADLLNAIQALYQLSYGPIRAHGGGGVLPPPPADINP